MKEVFAQCSTKIISLQRDPKGLCPRYEMKTAEQSEKFKTALSAAFPGLLELGAELCDICDDEVAAVRSALFLVKDAEIQTRTSALTETEMYFTLTEVRKIFQNIRHTLAQAYIAFGIIPVLRI